MFCTIDFSTSWLNTSATPGVSLCPSLSLTHWLIVEVCVLYSVTLEFHPCKMGY